ncbi:uroporphyrinogen-III C-methyltransferase [Staphylococcus lutrae]|uniref:uroporphyrinogen-III C-methyltransferase n=1 Tax=Staphylococcus lutrae TaxID=155085 RepID=A0AAC9WIW4_9STAP|nr:uroporphyrinogen-III C-methyltransferase [Staphylococcus lutrae]ARJ50550.1 uroporphyrinogen-III C-methyltransferase [Staphylococcus lutrae]PNZ36336.1 uroporphyrinogen-III C-methyltransferase [Staphylococcus lutrae]
MASLKQKMGKVYLVGAGPGDPQLLTKKAERCIQQADVILYDQLVNPLLLHLSSVHTEWIDVGKTPYTRTTQQERINALLIEKATTATYVVRLKGGDPSIFGRVTEEVETLRKHGIPFEIVPGITAASAAISQLGRGLTERGVSTNITFTTGHFKNNEENDIDMTTIAHGGTLAIYMGIHRLPQLMTAIQRHIDGNLPVVVIFNASRPNQHIVSGTVTTIIEQVQALPERLGPGLTIVGQVVRDVVVPSQSIKESLDTVWIEGERNEAMMVALEYVDAGWAAVVDDRRFGELHVSQCEKIARMVEETTFTRKVTLSQ